MSRELVALQVEHVLPMMSAAIRSGVTGCRDEINRAPAKTQSALLQAMQERMVTIDRDTHLLSPNFTVFATQKPD